MFPIMKQRERERDRKKRERKEKERDIRSQVFCCYEVLTSEF